MKPGPKPSGVETVSITFRMRKELRDQLRQSAFERDISMNAEIGLRLQRSYDGPALVDELADRLLAKVPNLVRLKERA